MIKLENVSLKYPIKSPVGYSLRHNLYGLVGGIIRGGDNRGLAYVQALDEINLVIDDGSRVGLIGHNGAGKTSLLRVMSGAYPPSSGSLTIKGKVNALTDLTLGMEPDESGRKNIIYRLVFMGHSFEAANSAIEEIIDFSDLGSFIDLPVRTYSTGMYLRLAFSIATHFPPDILILDEIIGAGDEAFQKKALARIERLLESARIVIFSSHDLNALKRYCQRGVLLKNGKVVIDGPVEDALQRYNT